MLTRETREVEQNVQVCYCDRCGAECPKIDNYLVGPSAFDCVSLTGVRSSQERNQRGTWWVGQPHGPDEVALCIECAKALREWLGRASEPSV